MRGLKSFGYKTLSYVLTVYLCIEFPHFFTYETGRAITAGFVILVILAELTEEEISAADNLYVKVKRFIYDHFSYLLFLSLTIFALGALNEKLFDSHPAEHNTLNGMATNAGFLPNGDGALYLLGIQSFLQYGILTFNTLYRPLAHTLNAVLYKISGSDMITYFYLTTFLLTGSLTYFGKVVAKILSKDMAAVSTFLLVLYFSRYQATFMTELLGGITGLLAMAGIISGFMSKNVFSLALGLLLFAISMQIRMGAVFIAPAIICLALVRFKKGSWISLIKPGLLFLFLFIAGMLIPRAQLSLFKEKSIVQSNAGYFLYQIQTGSNTWRQVMIDYPKDFMPEISYDETARKALHYARQKFMSEPSAFFINYGKKIIKTIQMPWDFLFHFWGESGVFPGLILFILLLFTPFLYPEDNAYRIFFWLLLGMIIGAVLSSPPLEEVRRRTYAASIAVNAISLSLAISNIIQILKICKARWSDVLRNKRNNWQMIYIRPAKITDTLSSNIRDGRSNKIANLSGLFIAFFIFVGPVVIDQIRKTALPELSGYDFSSQDSQTQFFLIDPKNSPGVKIHMNQDFKVKDPKQISKTKLKNNNHLCDTLTGSYYIYSAINLLSQPKEPHGLPFVMIPQKLVSGIDLKSDLKLLLKGKVIKPQKNILFIAENIQYRKEVSK
jgi:hypothetical protein